MTRDALVMIERLQKQIAVNPDTVMIREMPTDIVSLLTATSSFHRGA